jgi:type I restriction enzyme, S subunit
MSEASWGRVQLGDCGLLRNGVNFNQAQEGLGLPVIKVKDFGERVIAPSHGLDELDPSKIKIPSDQLLQEGDSVIIRSNGNGNLVGRCLYVSSIHRLTTFSGFCILFRPVRSRVDPRFVSYFIRSPLCRQRLVAFGSGTGIQNLTQGMISQIEFDLPPLNEQQAISHFLGALDDKIELSRRMNHTLQATATALFRSWFVDFDPVTAKAEGRQPYGMNVKTAALFPSAFQGSEIGPIPEGWDIKPIDDIADFENGLALQNFPPKSDEFLPVIKIRELRQGFADNSSDRASTSIKPSCIINDGDVIFSWSGSLMVDVWCGGRGALNQHLFKVTSTHYPKWFYLHWIHYHLEDFQDIASGKATTMGHIQRHHLSSAMVVVPSDEVIAKMDRSLTPILNKIISNRIQSRTLASIRDALLPRLLSGEIRVKEAEHIIATA